MTTEDDFQKLLDENPDDHHTRLVFADWLQDRDDPRADGYRALAVGRHYPHHLGGCGDQFLSTVEAGRCPYWRKLCPEWVAFPHNLPPDWFDRLDLFGGATAAPWWDLICTVTRRQCEDAAALAFTKLPAERRAELFAGALA